MINILWSQFDVNQQAKDISFESFCFQIAYLRYREFGFFENFFNTPGSEFYLKLHTDCPELNLQAGDEIGWQAKWWYNSEDNTSLTKDRREHLVNNFSTTLKDHPDIKLWIICTPASFTEKAFNELKTALQQLSLNTQFVHWNKETFRNFLSTEYSTFGALFQYYFNTNFIGFEYVKEYTERQIEYLQTKFDTDLYVPSHYDEEILNLLDFRYLFNELELKRTYIQDDITDVKQYLDRKDLESFLNPDYAKGVLGLIDFICQTLEDICAILDSKLTLEKCKEIDRKINAYLKTYRSYADKLNKIINENKWAIDEDSNRYNWKHQDIIEQINFLHSHFVEIEKSEERFRNHKPLPTSFTKLLDLLFQKDVHILSSAGYGKTNIACNIAKTCIEKNIPAVLLLGSNFRSSNLPQKTIIELLSIDRDYSFKEFLQALNTLGFIKGFKIPIIIDGLNESSPYKDIWRTHLFDIVSEIKKLEYLCLITTCRDRYINSIFEKEIVSDIKNTFILEGLTEKQKRLAIPKYFEKYNIVPTSLNFNKDLFKHPLLLKIFSEANEGAQNINISIDNVFQSFDKYYDNIIKKVTDDDIVSKRNINSRISQLCTKLWNDNSRDIDIVDFVSIIDSQKEKLAGSLADKILDEGLCLFQRNLDDAENEKIQFAYDLVAGYLIASKVILAEVKTADELAKYLSDNDIQKKLFDEDLAHPLAEDIMISLLYLLPTKYGVEFFEVFDNATTIEISCRNIDYYIGNSSGQDKIKKIFEKTTTDNPNFHLLLNKLFENIFQKGVHGLSSFALSVLLPLKQVEIDINWTEIIRKNNTEAYDLLTAINKVSLRDKLTLAEVEEFFYISFITSVSTNLVFRELATENLYLIGRNFPNQILNYCSVCYKFQDTNAIESLMASLCGTVFYVKNQDLTKDVMSFLIDDFLPNWNSTHIGIIEYILTISEFAFSKYGLDYSSQLRFNKSFTIPKLDSDDKQYSRFNSSLVGVDMYDFIKYQIAHISSDNYHKRDTFTEDDCIKIVLNRVKENGYNETLFEPINKLFREDDRYRYGRGSKIKFYAEKYLWQSYFEFVGYLFLENKLNSEDENRYRCLDIYFDPTFPKLPSRNQVIADCFFPEKDADIQEWINSEDQNFIDKYYIHKIFTDEEWVLLSASINQDGKENDTRFNLYTTAFLIENDNIDILKKDIDDKTYHSSDNTYFYNIFAGEIAWSKFLNDRENYSNEKYSLSELVWDYRWSSWSDNRYENQSFPFLNTEIANKNDLNFCIKDLSYYNINNEQVTKIMWSESMELYYIRKDLLDKIIKEQEKDLVWYQFVSKYGEFGKYNDNKLNPSFNDMRKLVKYDLIKKE